MTQTEYTINGVVVVVTYDALGNVVLVTFPYIAGDTSGTPYAISFAPGIAVANIQAWLAALIALLGL